MEKVQFDLQFITHFTESYSYYESAQIALQGDCKWIQLRMKESSLKEVEEEALRIQSLCKAHQAVFIIDDHVELAKYVKADGVHLGKNDMPVAQARTILGDDFIIGATANTFEDIVSHYQNGADYIGLGPFRFTTTKKNLSTILGIEGYEQIISLMQQHKINIPVVAIGGITLADIPGIMETGVTGIALSGSILRAPKPEEETRKIIQTIKQYKK